MVVDYFRPDGAVELFFGGAEEVEVVAGVLPSAWDASGYVVDNAEHTNNWGWVDGYVAGLVIEGDVTAGDRDGHCEAAVGETSRGLLELPHDLRVFRGAEVAAVGYCYWLGA